MRARWFVLLRPWGHLLLALAGRAAVAQGSLHPALTTTNGLVDNTVQSIAQDKQGFLWLGTQDGLSRFDGQTFRSYKADARQAGSLSGNFVRALAPARPGGLWLGTDYGLSYYNPITEQFSRVPSGAAAPYFVNTLLADPGGLVWVGTEDGLLRYDPGTRRLRRFRCEARGAAPSAGRHSSVRCLARDAAGTLWAGTGEGQLYRLDLAGGWLRLAAGYQPLGPAPLSALAAAPDGTLWLGTEEGGLYRRPATGGARELRPPRPGGAAVRAIWLDATGGAWVGTSGGLRYWPAGAATPATPIQPSQPADVLALAAGREGQLWVGTGTGLRWLDLRPPQFGLLPVGPVWAIGAAPGGLWLGTEQRGLLRLAATGQVAEQHRHRPADTTSLADNHIRCLLPDADGGLWVGTQRQGLDYRAAGATGFRHFRHVAGQPGSLADDFVRCLYRDPLDGALWVGTEGGLCRRAASGAGGFRAYLHRPDDPGGLPNSFVRCVLRDAAGRLWVGTGGGGLCRLDDPATGRFTTFRANARDGHGLPGNFVRALCLDASGRLWVGTEDGGLCRLDDPATGRFTTFGEAQGLPNSVIYSILADSATHSLWVSTNRGVARLDPASGRITAFDAQDGLPQLEYNASAGCRAPGGRLYFGGPLGAVGFRPAAVPAPAAPAVRLTGLRFFNQPAPLPDTAVGARRMLRLGPRNYVFTIEFTALDLRRAAHDRLQYQLEGFDPGWLAAAGRREATYTNLDPGRYTFRVRAVGTPAAAGAALALVVAPPWYGTWWFRALAASALVGAGWLAYRLRLGQLLALEQMRHRIARDLHDDMGSTLSSISILSALAHRHQESHHTEQVAGLLTQIGDSSRRMLDAMDDIVWTINPAHDSLADVTARMRAYAAELLEACGVELAFEAAPAVAALRLPMERRREFFLLFKEVITNLAKYAHARHARVALTYAGGQLHLLVADDGVGFDPAAPPLGSGNGRRNMQARAQALRGRLALATAPGQGTTVQLWLPV